MRTNHFLSISIKLKHSEKAYSWAWLQSGSVSDIRSLNDLLCWTERGMKQKKLWTLFPEMKLAWSVTRTVNMKRAMSTFSTPWSPLTLVWKEVFIKVNFITVLIKYSIMMYIWIQDHLYILWGQTIPLTSLVVVGGFQVHDLDTNIMQQLID